MLAKPTIVGYSWAMSLKNVAINAELHARLKEATKKNAQKIGRIVESLIEEWLRKADRHPRRKAG